MFSHGNHIHVNRSDFDFQDDDPDYWPRAEKSLADHYTRRIEPELVARNGNAHLTIAGFAPMPMLMKLGALVGDKTRANVMDLPNDGWLWDRSDACLEPRYNYYVPEKLPREVSVVVSISDMVTHPSGRYVVEFQAVSPDRGIIRKQEHLLTFRREFDAFLQRITRAGARVVHIVTSANI